METIKWNVSRKKITIRELLKTKDYFVPFSIIDQDVDVIGLIKNIDGTIHLPYVVKEFDDTTSSELHKKVFVSEHAAEFCVLKMLYTLTSNWSKYRGIDLECIESLSTKNGLLEAQQVHDFNSIKKRDAWTDKIGRALASACGVDDLDDITASAIEKLGKSKADFEELFTNTEIEVQWETAEYVGPKVELAFDGSMTVADFKKSFCDVFHAIPDLLGADNVSYADNLTLSQIGIDGKRTFGIPPHSEVSRINIAFKKQFGVGLFLMYKNRPWAHIVGSVNLPDVEKLPSIWDSLRWAIVWKLFGKMI